MKLRNRSALQARLRGPYPHPEDSDKNEDNSASDDCSADVEMPDGSGKDWQDTWSPDDLGSWKAEDEDELAYGDDDIDDDGDDDIDDHESMQVSEAHEDVASSAVKHDTAEKILVRVSKKGKQNPGETPGAPAIQGSGFQDGQVIHTAEDDLYIWQVDGDFRMGSLIGLTNKLERAKSDLHSSEKPEAQCQLTRKPVPKQMGIGHTTLARVGINRYPSSGHRHTPRT